MSRGLTKKREAFCQAYVRLGNQRKAYIEAYQIPEGKIDVLSIDPRASRLMSDSKVKARIAQLRDKATKGLRRTVEDLDRMYQRAFEVAEITQQSGAMTSATNGLMKLHGLDQRADQAQPSKAISARVDTLLAKRQAAMGGEEAKASEPKPEPPKPKPKRPTVQGTGTA